MNSTGILTGIRDANYHEGGIRCLQLFRIDYAFFVALAEEVRRFCVTERPSSVSEPNHVTNWTRPRGEVFQYSLLNRSGRSDDFAEDHDLLTNGKSFRAAEVYPVLAQFIAEWPDVLNFRINVMGPRARLAAHEEHSVIRTPAGSVAVRARFHMPVVTNPAAELMLDGDIFHLEAGVVYLVNHGCVHSATAGLERRVHLVWDMLLSRSAREFVFDEPDQTPWLEAIPSAEQVPAALRSERVGAYLQLPPPVTREQAEAIAWCDEQ